MTKQSKNRIAVVSSRDAFRNFFAWEAEACDCPVEVFSSLPQDLTAFDWIVADREAADSLFEQKDRRVVIVCDSGGGSRLVAKALLALARIGAEGASAV